MKEISLDDKRKKKIMADNYNTLDGFMEYMKNERAKNGKCIIEFDQKVFKQVKHMILDHKRKADVTFVDGLDTEIVIAIEKQRFYDTNILLVGGYGGSVEVYNLDCESLIMSDDNERKKYMLMGDTEEKVDYLVKCIIKDVFNKYDICEIVDVRA